jgi:hypothetical protein
MMSIEIKFKKYSRFKVHLMQSTSMYPAVGNPMNQRLQIQSQIISSLISTIIDLGNLITKQVKRNGLFF